MGSAPEKTLAGYFFYGEESFPAFLFVEDTVAAVAAQKKDEPQVERFSLDSHGWSDIIDSARAVSLLQPSLRLLLIESPPRKKEHLPSPHEKLSETAKLIIAEYFAEPPTNTSLVIVYPGKIKRSSPLVKFFTSLPTSAVRVTELRPWKEYEILPWIQERLSNHNKTIGREGAHRLLELTGNDLRQIKNEMEKIITFVGDKKSIDVDDIDQVTGSIKSYVEWELTNTLESANYRECLLIINRLLEAEGIPPGRILGLILGFFRDVLIVKLRLKEGEMDRKAIFKEIKPHIQEKFRSLYQKQFQLLFVVADSISWENLNQMLNRLKDVELKLKTTNLDFQFLIEGFLFEYCWMRRYG